MLVSLLAAGSSAEAKNQTLWMSEFLGMYGLPSTALKASSNLTGLRPVPEPRINTALAWRVLARSFVPLTRTHAPLWHTLTIQFD